MGYREEGVRHLYVGTRKYTKMGIPKKEEVYILPVEVEEGFPDRKRMTKAYRLFVGRSIKEVEGDIKNIKHRAERIQQIYKRHLTIVRYIPLTPGMKERLKKEHIEDIKLIEPWYLSMIYPLLKMLGVEI